ncbi:uncharacterized protein LOC106708016 [Papilio machaon]|uniref:uncharacterized protein LOC106708016 n=1 Tax=Papilio machaon TaxID=76193 RepID=UPI001E664DD0|nr:uncharacterized protein LOC106708016 [Papilio machaon]
MRKNHFIIFGLLLTVAYLTPVRSESDQEDNVENVEEKSDVNPLESKKGDELLEDKNDEAIHAVTESRVERSSEGASDHSIATAEVKTAKENQHVEIDIDENSRRSSSDNTNRKSSGFKIDSEKSDLNLNRDDDVASERSLTNNEDEFEEYSIDDMEKTGKDDELSEKNDAEIEEIEGRSVDEKLPIDSSRSVSLEAQDAILDHKARTAQKFDDVEPSVDSSIEANDNIKVLGSRRSFSGDPSPDSLVNLGRTGDIFNENFFPNNQNPLQFQKITSSETIMPKGFFSPPPIPIKFNNFGTPNNPQKPYDPFTSSESKPLDEFNFNPFSNSYPYAYNLKPIATTTPKPIEISSFRKNPSEFFPKFPPPPSINSSPKVNILGDNFQPFYPVTVRPLETRLLFPSFGVQRINRFPNVPYFYRPKCSTCA